jgi:hypothetical protein
MKKNPVENEQYFATTMEDMGGNRGVSEENEVLWDLGAEGKEHKEKPTKIKK